MSSTITSFDEKRHTFADAPLNKAARDAIKMQQQFINPVKKQTKIEAAFKELERDRAGSSSHKEENKYPEISQPTNPKHNFHAETEKEALDFFKKTKDRNKKVSAAEDCLTKLGKKLPKSPFFKRLKKATQAFFNSKPVNPATNNISPQNPYFNLLKDITAAKHSLKPKIPTKPSRESFKFPTAPVAKLTPPSLPPRSKTEKK